MRESKLAIVTIEVVDGNAKTLSSTEKWIDGATFQSPCMDGAQVGDKWVVLIEPSVSVFGAIEKAILIKR